MTAWSDDQLRLELGTHRSPLVELVETEQEWWLGTLAIHKHQRRFRSGFGHELVAEAQFRAQPFALGDKRGVAILFHAFDHGEPAEYFVGWVPHERAADAGSWIAFLNREIAQRFGDDYERATLQAEVEHFERTRGIAPSKHPDGGRTRDAVAMTGQDDPNRAVLDAQAAQRAAKTARAAAIAAGRAHADPSPVFLGPARNVTEMRFAASLEPCPRCNERDTGPLDLRGHGTTWALSGTCPRCGKPRGFGYGTVGDPNGLEGGATSSASGRRG